MYKLYIYIYIFYFPPSLVILIYLLHNIIYVDECEVTSTTNDDGDKKETNKNDDITKKDNGVTKKDNSCKTETEKIKGISKNIF